MQPKKYSGFRNTWGRKSTIVFRSRYIHLANKSLAEKAEKERLEQQLYSGTPIKPHKKILGLSQDFVIVMLIIGFLLWIIFP